MSTAPYGTRDVTLFVCRENFLGYYHTFREYSKSYSETNEIKRWITTFGRAKQVKITG